MLTAQEIIGFIAPYVRFLLRYCNDYHFDNDVDLLRETCDQLNLARMALGPSPTVGNLIRIQEHLKKASQGLLQVSMNKCIRNDASWFFFSTAGHSIMSLIGENYFPAPTMIPMVCVCVCLNTVELRVSFNFVNQNCRFHGSPMDKILI